MPVGIECKGDAPDATGGGAAQFLHVCMLRAGQGVGMRSSERRPLALEEQHPREDRVLNLRAEFVELRLKLIGEGNGSGHSVLMS